LSPHGPVVVAARRTPIGTVGKGLAGITVDRLAAPVLAALIDDAGLAPCEIADVVLGNCMGPGGNVARVAALGAGLGTAVPGVTVDRQCGSGLEAVNLAAALVRAGAGEAYLAGGAESPSTAPWRGYARARFAPEGWPDPDMGEAAEMVAAEARISRGRQDAYAARSHALAAAERAVGGFAAELVPVAGVNADDRPRDGLTAARLARFRPAFVAGGTVTAGNSCGVSDGAAAVAVVSERLRAERGLVGLRVLGWQVAGVDVARPGLGPVAAVPSLLARYGLTVGDVGAVEITEAFAGQVLACLDALDIEEERVCAGGGAIALGHPWGASGAVLLVRLFTRMVRRRGPRYGLAACAVGGGMGVATLVERVEG
jgi:acetyl-CoA C-acetyltransferase